MACADCRGLALLCGGSSSSTAEPELSFPPLHAEAHEVRGAEEAADLALAKAVILRAFAALVRQSREQQERYESAGVKPSARESREWAAYLDDARLRRSMVAALEFARGLPEYRLHLLQAPRLRHSRYLVLLQHFVAEDVADVFRPAEERRHADKFEGVLTRASVNSQLVKDAHRSEWAVDGQAFAMRECADGQGGGGDGKQAIKAFQAGLVSALERFLLDFAGRRGLSQEGTDDLLRAVTTQMSQCGLANLDRASGAKVFVSGQGLKQRTFYGVSTMEMGSRGEVVKLSLLCMKTGFGSYLTPERLAVLQDGGDGELGPLKCSPSSYIYQYATICFAPVRTFQAGARAVPREVVEVAVVDGLDEVFIDPPGHAVSELEEGAVLL